MSIIDAIMGKNMAIDELAKDGRVASFIKRSTQSEKYEISTETNEEMGGLCVSIVQGTFGVKETDDYVSLILGDDFNYLPYWCDYQPVTSPMYIGNKGLAFPDEENTGVGLLVLIDFSQNTSLVITNSPKIVKMKVVRYFRDIVPIDPKYLPSVDSITMNGADGNQYKLTVNESGELAVTAV